MIMAKQKFVWLKTTYFGKPDNHAAMTHYGDVWSIEAIFNNFDCKLCCFVNKKMVVDGLKGAQCLCKMGRMRSTVRLVENFFHIAIALLSQNYSFQHLV